MITAVDTNIILDILHGAPRFGPLSRQALARATDAGKLVACDAVWAEIASAFRDAAQARGVLESLGVEYSETSPEASVRAGAAFRAHREHGGKRTRVVADFLIGAHAVHHADRLLTRDRGYFATYFSELEILDPTA